MTKTNNDKGLKPEQRYIVHATKITGHDRRDYTAVYGTVEFLRLQELFMLGLNDSPRAIMVKITNEDQSVFIPYDHVTSITEAPELKELQESQDFQRYGKLYDARIYIPGGKMITKEDMQRAVASADKTDKPKRQYNKRKTDDQ